MAEKDACCDLKRQETKAIMILSSYLLPEHTQKNEHYHLSNI